MGEQWISIADAAVRLRLSYNQILRFVLIGELSGKRRGNRWVVEANAVKEMAAHRHKESTETDGVS